MKRLALGVLLGLLVVLAQRASAHHGCCCDCCQCDCCVEKVCRVVCETKKVPVVCYDCTCEDFCIPCPSERCGKHCETDPCCDCRSWMKWDWIPSCGVVHTRHKLVKRTVEKEVTTYKWVVQELCPHCCASAQNEGPNNAPGLGPAPAVPQVPSQYTASKPAESEKSATRFVSLTKEQATTSR